MKLRTLTKFKYYWDKKHLAKKLAKIRYVGSGKCLISDMFRHRRLTRTRVGESVSLKVTTLKKPHMAHGASIWLHP